MPPSGQSQSERDLCENKLWLARLRADFGSVWAIEECAWRDYLSDYAGGRDRIGHPGVSVRRNPPPSYFDMLPLLFGCTAQWWHRKQKGLVFARLSPSDQEHETVFGTISEPARIWIAEFDGRRTYSRIKRWREKAEFDPDEKADLGAWCLRNQVWPDG